MTEPLEVTDALLDEVDRLSAAATPGPWDHDPDMMYACVTSQSDGHGTTLLHARSGTVECHRVDFVANAAFSAFTRDALPALAAEVRRLRAITQSLADRVAAQSDILSRRAEKGASS